MILLILTLVFSANLLMVYAYEEIKLPSVSLQPGMTYYPAKRLFEKFMEKLQFSSDAKEKYYYDLLGVRLSELNNIVEKDNRNEVEKSTQRVSYQVGVLTDYIVEKRLDNKKQQVINLYKSYRIILEKLRDKYPANSSYWMLVQHIINSIDINLKKL